jgi:hypothetical protein
MAFAINDPVVVEFDGATDVPVGITVCVIFEETPVTVTVAVTFDDAVLLRWVIVAFAVVDEGTTVPVVFEGTTLPVVFEIACVVDDGPTVCVVFQGTTLPVVFEGATLPVVFADACVVDVGAIVVELELDGHSSLHLKHSLSSIRCWRPSFSLEGLLWNLLLISNISII